MVLFGTHQRADLVYYDQFYQNALVVQFGMKLVGVQDGMNLQKEVVLQIQEPYQVIVALKVGTILVSQWLIGISNMV